MASTVGSQPMTSVPLPVTLPPSETSNVRVMKLRFWVHRQTFFTVLPSRSSLHSPIIQARQRRGS